MARKPHILDYHQAFRDHLAYRTPHNTGVGDSAIDQTLQMLADGRVTRMQAGSGLLPIVGGDAEDPSHGQCTLEDRLVVLEARDRRDGIPRNFAVVSELQDPGDP
jgi:hypothetical protein